jgi:hypothetical protein
MVDAYAEGGLMFKLILILLVALGFGLSQPRSRAVILDVASPVIDPIYGFITNRQLKQVIEDLEDFEERTGNLPYGGSGEFESWLRREYRDVKRRSDAWGNPFELVLEISVFTVTSAGPDEVFETEDDLAASGVRGVTEL